MALILTGCGQVTINTPFPNGSFEPLSGNCTVVQTSVGATISCPDGSSAQIMNGTNGLSGTNGTNGSNGSNGSNGTDGTVVQSVQFCPNYTLSYPSMFPEVGFCIDNKIYAVYYDGKNAWMSVIPPGSYASTSTSAPCNFTVAPGCVVTQ